MIIGSDYPRPVMVNGYACENCSDVGKAKRNIDPDHPADGPFGIYAKKDRSGLDQPAVTLGGALAELSPARSSTEGSSSSRAGPNPVGRLDISV